MVHIAFICVKSYDTAWAAAMIKPYLAPGGYAVSLQNCINEPVIAGIVGEDRTLGSIASSITVELTGPGQVFRAAGKSGASHTVFRVGQPDGRISDRVDQVRELVALTDSALATTDLAGERWTKLVLNDGNGVPPAPARRAARASPTIASASSWRGSAARRSASARSSAIIWRRCFISTPKSSPAPAKAIREAKRIYDQNRLELDQQARRRRASPVDGAGHGEGTPHRDR